MRLRPARVLEKRAMQAPGMLSSEPGGRAADPNRGPKGCASVIGMALNQENLSSKGIKVPLWKRGI